MALTAETYRRVVSEDPDGIWELIDGRLREKPPMTFRHADVCALLSHYLMDQLDLQAFRVHVNHARLERNERNYFVPDLAVIPAEHFADFKDRMDVLEFYSKPLPLVVEVWSPSTGLYDVDTIVPEYRARGDREIWRIHPYDRTLTAWRRQPNGQYLETSYAEGSVSPASLPRVTIELAKLFI
jgi:Uma2 family endonuclease